MSENLAPLEGANYGLWAAKSSTGTPTGTLVAGASPSGAADAYKLTSTQTSGTLWAQASVNVSGESVLALGVTYKVDATESVVPFEVLFYAGSTLIETVTPIAGAAASTSNAEFNAAAVVPQGATNATLKYGVMTVTAGSQYVELSDIVCAAL
jgi:hypothetical protein